ncbi:V-type ATP synthase subunit F [Treponema primitia]|uniref:V-type ATP synthase subunit F n=1 Tax=Treponema primitia TaxID=88058 RepID=UPI00025557C8|nr:V-type ATP synthase subunit F [Treponema primitia]
MDYYFIGDAELLTAFRFIGIDGTPVTNAETARAAFLGITRGWDETAQAVLPSAYAGKGCRVLILTEEAADWLGEDLTDWQLSGEYPLVVEIPGTLGHLPGRKTLVDSIREAVGVHV